MCPHNPEIDRTEREAYSYGPRTELPLCPICKTPYMARLRWPMFLCSNCRWVGSRDELEQLTIENDRQIIIKLFKTLCIEVASVIAKPLIWFINKIKSYGKR